MKANSIINLLINMFLNYQFSNNFIVHYTACLSLRISLKSLPILLTHKIKTKKNKKK